MRKDRNRADERSVAREIVPARACRLQERRARPNSWSQERRKCFLDVVAASCNVRRAAAAAGMSVQACYGLRQRDERFAAAWQEALTLGFERLESLLAARSIERLDPYPIDMEAGDAIVHQAVPAADAAGDETGIGPANAETVAIRSAAGFSGVGGPLSLAEVQAALAVLAQRGHHVAGRRVKRFGKPRLTDAEIDAVLNRKLDALARRLADTARAPGVGADDAHASAPPDTSA